MIMKCTVVRCNKEVYEPGMCSNCQELIENTKEYVPLVCWKCGSILDIFLKEKKMGMIFSKGCRECSNEQDEKDTFLIKKE